MTEYDAHRCAFTNMSDIWMSHLGHMPTFWNSASFAKESLGRDILFYFLHLCRRGVGSTGREEP